MGSVSLKGGIAGEGGFNFMGTLLEKPLSKIALENVDETLGFKCEMLDNIILSFLKRIHYSGEM